MTSTSFFTFHLFCTQSITFQSGRLSLAKRRSGPPSSQSTAPRDFGPTEFRRYYDRGDLPIALQHKAGENGIQWKIEPEELDYNHFLPIFFEGLRETVEPYQLLAKQGIYDMLERGNRKILNVIPQLILPIKSFLFSSLSHC